jgi:glucuronate isomerase
MARLRRFEEYRYVGTRDDMVVYDTDDGAQASAIHQRIDDDDLLGRDLLQTFAPDAIPEARNRGFRPAPSRVVS